MIFSLRVSGESRINSEIMETDYSPMNTFYLKNHKIKIEQQPLPGSAMGIDSGGLFVLHGGSSRATPLALAANTGTSPDISRIF
jgi:hypothetical protein